MEGLHPLLAELIIALVLAVASLSLLDDTLAGLAQKVPVLGPVLAPLVRHLSARTRYWLRSQVPVSAERAVCEAEGQIGNGQGAVKAARATARLKALEPGLTDNELQREIQAAYDRLVGATRLAAPKATPPKLGAPAKSLKEGL